MEGIGDNKNPVIDILGLSGKETLSEGIFSQDPQERMDIEIKYYNHLRADLRDLKESMPDDDSHFFAQQRAIKEARIYKFEQQFIQLYDEPITQQAPTR